MLMDKILLILVCNLKLDENVKCHENNDCMTTTYVKYCTETVSC